MATSGKLGGGKWLKRWRRLALYMRAGFRCAYCNVSLATPKRIKYDVSVDHVRPRAGDGPEDHSDSNLVMVCFKCNSRKGKRPLESFADPSASDRVRVETARPIPEKRAKMLFALVAKGVATWDAIYRMAAYRADIVAK